MTTVGEHDKWSYELKPLIQTAQYTAVDGHKYEWCQLCEWLYQWVML